jgi:hypothetical protein
MELLNIMVLLNMLAMMSHITPEVQVCNRKTAQWNVCYLRLFCRLERDIGVSKTVG